jgi:hypothetical protein
MSCCERFEKASNGAVSLSPLAIGAPYGGRPQGQIEFSGGTWNVNGCCGGGCYVLTELKFCPWCGSQLEPTT